MLKVVWSISRYKNVCSRLHKQMTISGKNYSSRIILWIKKRYGHNCVGSHFMQNIYDWLSFFLEKEYVSGYIREGTKTL